MKIAYILDWNIRSNAGVLNKIAAKIRFWEKDGHEVLLCIISYGTQEEYLPKDLAHIKVFERPELGYLVVDKAKAYIGRTLAYRDVYRYLKQYGPDVVYLRQPGMWYPSVDRLCSGFKTVLEANTLDLKEIRHYYKGLYKSIYVFGRKHILDRVSGIVAVTNEIAESFRPASIPIASISNSIDVSSIAQVVYKKQDRPQILFVGTPGQPWHGTDMILTMAALLPMFTFHIVGPEISTDKPDNVIAHGYMNSAQLKELYTIIDIGIGSLALFRQDMEEACPLKVREYLSMGLPVILGYIDSDVHDKPFALYIGNYEKSVSDNIEKIKSFVYQWNGKRLKKEDVFDLIDVSVKEKQRLSFLQQVASASS